MNEHEPSLRVDELRERWIDSLLLSATTEQDHTTRIARVISQLESEQAKSPLIHSFRSRRRLLWYGIGMAAALLLAWFLLVPTGRSQSAMAAIQRSMNVAAQPITRKYLLQIESQLMTGEIRRTDVDLYVYGNSRLVMRLPGPVPQTYFWLGQNGSHSWIVPPLGPVLRGDKMLLIRWIRTREELDMPFMRATTVMECMLSRGYRLDALQDETITIPGGSIVKCQHIQASREVVNQQDYPDAIELWSSRESGMAMRMLARWRREPGEPGRKSVRVTFQNDEPSRPLDWYVAQSHYEGRRAVIRMDASGNL